MNNTTIGIIIGIILFGVIAVIVFQDEGPPRIDFNEVISDRVADDTQPGAEEEEKEDSF